MPTSPALFRFHLSALPIAFFAALALTASALADDGAASVAAGGIVMVHEPRITMQKEVLRIDESKVMVDYEFRNDTGRDVVTEVAFPVPAYSLEDDWHSDSLKGFDDFQLLIGGNPVHYEIETKTMFKGRDVSSQLRVMGIDIVTFGHYDEDAQSAGDLKRLTEMERKALQQNGLIDTDHRATWSVEKRYHWQQTFPAHTVIKISHRYTPVIGASSSIAYDFDPTAGKESKEEVGSLCLDPALRKTLLGLASRAGVNVSLAYVDFILTTANTWKTPIEDFTLIVGRSHEPDAGRSYASFCWDGPVTKSDADHFVAHLNNLVPKKELRVGFISVSKAP